MLANIRRRAAELLYSRLRHATHLQNRADQLQHEADHLRAQLAGLSGARAQLEHDVAAQIAGRANDAHAYRAMLGKSFLMHRNFFDALKVDLAGATSSQATSVAMLQRIQAAYRLAGATELKPHDSFWTTAADYAKQPIHDALLAADTAALEKVFAAPVETSLFYGFDTLNQANQGNMHPSEHQWRADWSYDNLLRLCEAVGVVRLEYPEAGARTSYPNTEELLEKLDAAFGFRIDFPNVYAGETGLKTSRGAASYRAVQALYQAWLIRKTKAEKVVEIGAGMGRTAYYASRFGIRDYTIVDLPLTNVSQAGFLGLTLGEPSISLYGEAMDKAIKIIPPAPFLDSGDTYDLIVNVDSMTEMSRDYATRYFEAASRRSRALLSINHEFNSFTVREIAGPIESTYRHEYWLRRGYVEELFTFRGAG